MLNSERRLLALELAANAGDDELKVICVSPGESEHEAAHMAGLPPHMFQRMRFLFISPTDLLL